MAERVSAHKRIELANVAEQEIMRYADNDALWLKHCCGVELDPIQVLKCKEMDDHQNTLDFSSRRTGKTAVKEMKLLKHNACNSDQSLGIVAPREAQSIDNLNYHLEMIRGSEILSAYIRHKSGRAQLSDTYYQFQNRSVAKAYGIMAQVDGGDLTVASLEEVDDMPADRLYGRFLLMLGATRRLGASKDSVNDPQIRITGVYKGADTLTDLIDSGKYHVIGALHGDRAKTEVRRFIAEGWLDANQVDVDGYNYPVPIGNAVIAMQMGLLNKQFIMDMRDQLSMDEFARQLLCVNTSSRNLIWDAWLQKAVQLGVKAMLEPKPPIPGETYRKRGRVAFGYDHTGHGEDPKSSKSALVVSEDLAGYLVPIWAKQWPLGTSEATIKNDLKAFWTYYQPDAAIGDAYGIGMLTQLNIELFAEGLTDVDINTLGPSNASTWPDWPFAPMRFEGHVKHTMATGLAAMYNNNRVAHPYVGYVDDEESEDVAGLILLQKQLTNIKAEETSKSYSRYSMVRKDIGDDLFDADMASYQALMLGAVSIPTAILVEHRERDRFITDQRGTAHGAA